jgi:hypothetical protein
MADLTGQRRNIQIEESRFRYAVSEALVQKVGSSINFINDYQYSEKQFFANGPYSTAPSFPQTGVDGLTFFDFDAEIINVWAFNLVAGSGGTTELDIKRATASAGAFTSIFSTTPKFDSTAAANSYVDANGNQAATTGVTAPVVTTTNVNAGDALRFDIVSSMTGSPQNCGVIVHYRPR